jgi:hypothetical protein
MAATWSVLWTRANMAAASLSVRTHHYEPKCHGEWHQNNARIGKFVQLSANRVLRLALPHYALV